jgi:hypothetical protein
MYEVVVVAHYMTTNTLASVSTHAMAYGNVSAGAALAICFS